jgi:hypothetical protein
MAPRTVSRLRRQPSRRLHSLVLVPSPAQRFRQAVVSSAYCLGFVTWPVFVWGASAWPWAAGLAALLSYCMANGHYWCKRMRAERAADSICTFARSFPRREVDTWVIRAVWDQLDLRFPVRAEDRLTDDLGMDDVDLDFDMAGVADRCGRSLATPERNPWYGKVETVGDLVRFVAAQPRVSAALPS